MKNPQGERESSPISVRLLRLFAKLRAQDERIRHLALPVRHSVNEGGRVLSQVKLDEERLEWVTENQ